MGRFRPRPIALWSAGLTLLMAVAGLVAQETTIKVDVRLVRLLVSVKDRTGNLVGDLAKEEFQVTDNGVPQTIRLFERQSAQPLSISLLIDTSGSTHKEIKYETDAAARFFRAVFGEGNRSDAVSLYSFNWQVSQHTGFTRRMEQLQAGLRDLKPEAGTAMYDAIYLACEDLREREGRHVMVIVTDGGDTTSSKSYQSAIEALHGADAVLYPVLVMPITNEAGRNIGGENALTTMARELGGRVFAPSLASGLDQAFADILRELRTQYLLGYYPQNVPVTRDRFHRTTVTVQRPNLAIQTRTGYYGEATASYGRGGPQVPE